MTASRPDGLKSLPIRPSFEALRKEAKQLVRWVAAADTLAIARARAQLPNLQLPRLSQRDAQLAIAREYGFSGWLDLKAEVSKRTGRGFERAVALAKRAIHDNDVEQLRLLLSAHPELTTWREPSGRSLLHVSAESFGDSFDADRERMFTRLECTEFLIDAGVGVDASICERVVDARARDMLELLQRKGVLPTALKVSAALGDVGMLGRSLASLPPPHLVHEAFFTACRFHQGPAASLLLDACIAIDPPLAQRIDSWRSREMFIAYFGERLELLRFSKGGVNRVVEPWRALVVHEALRAIQDKNVDELVCWLRDELSLLSDECVGLQVELLERATWTNGEPMIRALFDLDPAILRCAVPPQSGALEFAMEYGHAHLVPLLTRIWSMPDDLPHAAGMGILARVKQWFDEAGRPALRDLGTHFPVNNPTKLRHLQWDDGNEQCVLDTALAWACMNKQLEVAAYLVERGADLNTNWGTHEPAGILHECAMHGNYEAAQFLIDRGVDLGKLDYRWRATARGWAHYAAKDQQMADFLLAAERAKGGDNDIEGS